MSFINGFSSLSISLSDITGEVQRHLEGADDSVLKSEHGIRMIQHSWYISTKDKKNHMYTRIIKNMQLMGESRLRRSTSKLECVRKFRWFRNIRTSGLKELKGAAAGTLRRDTWAFKMAPIREPFRFQISPGLSKSTCRVPITALSKNTMADACCRSAGTLPRKTERSKKSTQQVPLLVDESRLYHSSTLKIKNRRYSLLNLGSINFSKHK